MQNYCKKCHKKTEHYRECVLFETIEYVCPECEAKETNQGCWFTLIGTVIVLAIILCVAIFT
jgi:hypothetical protein